jgi:aminoacrylate hydrolase
MAEVRADDGCRISYAVDGEGPPLLLIAGLGGLASFWSGVRRHMPDFRTVSFDHRGTGASERPAGGYSIERMARDALAVLDDLRLGRVDVVGHSTGGAVAQVLAAEHPGRVNRLVISGSWDRPDTGFRMLFESRLEILLRSGPETYQKLTHVLGYGPGWLEAHAEDLDAAVSNAAQALEPLAASAARIRMLLEWQGLPDLGRISAPTLILASRDDLMIPFHHAEALARGIPSAVLVPMSGGHFYPRTDPERFAATVSAFLLQEISR